MGALVKAHLRGWGQEDWRAIATTKAAAGGAAAAPGCGRNHLPLALGRAAGVLHKKHALCLSKA